MPVELTFLLLALAIGSLWASGGESASSIRRHGWLIVFGAALAAGFAAGVLRPSGLVASVVFGGALLAYYRWPQQGIRAWLSAIGVLAVSTALMLHRVPGFNNPCVIDAVRFTPEAVPFSLYLNFDKTLIGLFILGWGHRRLKRFTDWRAMARSALPITAGTIAVVMILAVSAGCVRFAPKLPGETALWLGVNLLFVCVAEEALFRGFIQAELRKQWAAVRHGTALALIVSALFFGLAHAAGGVSYVALATIAGLGYGWAYQRTGRIEASILTHFALNGVHFFFFTYPAVA
jgi:uncharacterized protein